MALLLSKQEFGVLSVVYPLILVLPGVLTLGQSISSLKFLTNADFNQGSVLFHAFLIFFFFNITIIFVLSALLFIWNDFSIGDYTLIDIAPTAFIAAVCLSFLTIFNQHAQANGQARVFVLFNTVPKLFFVATVLILCLFLNLNTLLVLYIYCFILLTFVIYALIRLRSFLIFNFDFEVIKKMLVIGSPLAVSAFALILNSFASRSFLNSTGGIEGVADYSFMLVMSQSCLIFFATFSRFYIPKLFKILNANMSHLVFIQETNKFLYLGTFSIVVSVYLFVIYFSPIYLPEYELDPLFFGLMVATNFPYILYITMVDTISFKERGKKLIYLNLILGSFTTFMSFFAVKQFGLQGAVFTFFCSAWLQGLMISFVCRDIFLVPQNIINLIIINLFFFSFVLFIKLMPEFSSEASVIMLIALLGLLFFRRSSLVNYIKLFEQ